MSTYKPMAEKELSFRVWSSTIKCHFVIMFPPKNYFPSLEFFR